MYVTADECPTSKVNVLAMAIARPAQPASIVGFKNIRRATSPIRKALPSWNRTDNQRCTKVDVHLFAHEMVQCGLHPDVQ